MRAVPKTLRIWFFIHFIVDYLFAIPLLLIPRQFVGVFGFTGDPFLSRLVAAALISIGGISLWYLGSDSDVYDALLSLKLLWSVSAAGGILITQLKGAPATGWVFFAIFAFFAIIWIRYKMYLRYEFVILKR